MTETIKASETLPKPKADAKVRKALTKGSSIARELGDLSLSNARACVASGRIALSGLSDLGKANASETRSVFAQLSDGLKGVSAVQSPVEFYKLQGDLMRKTFEAAISFNARNREALIKLAEDASAPLKLQANNVVAAFGKSA